MRSDCVEYKNQNSVWKQVEYEEIYFSETIASHIACIQNQESIKYRINIITAFLFLNHF